MNNNKKILILGDIILDIWIKGNYNRRSPEAPVKILDEMLEFKNLGGAANVAANLKNLNNEFDFTVFNSSLSKKWFWIKFLICFMFIRQSYIWLTHTDQNFLTVFIYDIINVLVPFIAVWLFLGLSIKTFKKINHPKFFRSLSFLLLFIK